MPPAKVLFNAVSAKMGGASSYLRAVVPELHRRSLPFEVLVCVPPEQREALQRAAPGFRVFSPPASALAGPAGRLAFDQLGLRRLLHHERVELLYSTANFGVLGAPCRQLLLVRNALYFDPLYLEQILPEKPLRLQLGEWARRELTWASVRAADTVIVPSKTLAEQMAAAGGARERIRVIPYGVDPVRFAAPAERPPPSATPRLLFTSLWAEHKNLDTLLRALTHLRRHGVAAKLTTTANPLLEPARGEAHRRDWELARALLWTGALALLPPRSSERVAELYAAADIFVYPSVVESFGHPLLEAMAAGLPVVAADVAINRELCRDAALYFSPFAPAECAAQVRRVLDDAPLRRTLVERGLARARAFSWAAHVDGLVEAFSGRV